MKIIGVTGGIGSGKSTVSGILNSFGARVIDADSLAREIVKKGGKALIELVAEYGTGILTADGELDRKKLAQSVFGIPEKVEKLKSITHKYVADRIYDDVSSLKNDPSVDLIVVDAVFPVKRGFMDVVDEVWVVTADIEVRICRVMNRSGLTRTEVIDRMQSQLDDMDYLKIADRVINNSGSIEILEKTVKSMLKGAN